MRSLFRTTLTVIIKHYGNSISYLRHSIRSSQNIFYRIRKIMRCAVSKSPIQSCSRTCSIVHIRSQTADICPFWKQESNCPCFIINLTYYIFFQNGILQFIKIKACKSCLIWILHINCDCYRQNCPCLYILHLIFTHISPSRCSNNSAIRKCIRESGYVGSLQTSWKILTDHNSFILPAPTCDHSWINILYLSFSCRQMKIYSRNW